MNHKDRKKFYLGENLVKSSFDINDFSNNFTITQLTNGKHRLDKHYDVPLKKLIIKTNNQSNFFYFRRCDITHKSQQHMLTLCKNRAPDFNESVLLRSLDFKRHWFYFYNSPIQLKLNNSFLICLLNLLKIEVDIPFSLKKNKVFWRGTTTGYNYIDETSQTDFIPKIANRFELVEKWFDNKYMDLGFSFIHRNFLKEKYNKYVKGKCNISKFLQYKYILSIEGNDKDSGLNWKLNSNSLVLMAKPRVTSWLMETKLIPNYHYILLEDDFSDLEDKINWCNKNPSKCKEIISNAHDFMSQFEDNQNEIQLELDVINKYFKILNSKRLNMDKYKNKVTMVICTCKRLNCFIKSMDNFFKNCLDHQLISKFIIFDDNSSNYDRDYMIKKYPNFKFIFKKYNEKGHSKSLNMISKYVQTKYFLNWEDDTEFKKPRNYIMDSIDILESKESKDNNIVQVLFNDSGFSYQQKNNEKLRIEKPIPHMVHIIDDETLLPESSDNFIIGIHHWPGYSDNAYIMHTDVLKNVGDFIDNSSKSEVDFSLRFRNNGLKTCYLLDSGLKWNSNISSYVLNNNIRIWDNKWFGVEYTILKYIIFNFFRYDTWRKVWYIIVGKV